MPTRVGSVAPVTEAPSCRPLTEMPSMVTLLALLTVSRPSMSRPLVGELPLLTSEEGASIVTVPRPTIEMPSRPWPLTLTCSV